MASEQVGNADDVVRMQMREEQLAHLGEVHSSLRQPERHATPAIEQQLLIPGFHERARAIAVQITGGPAPVPSNVTLMAGASDVAGRAPCCDMRGRSAIPTNTMRRSEPCRFGCF